MYGNRITVIFFAHSHEDIFHFVARWRCVFTFKTKGSPRNQFDALTFVTVPHRTQQQNNLSEYRVWFGAKHLFVDDLTLKNVKSENS